MSILETVDLRKSYKPLRGSKVNAVDGLSLSVTEPGVYGFLGPNGSGKTTTIRCLLGLIKPTSGSIKLLGEDVTRGIKPVIDRIGALVETPKFFPNYSARKNLQMLASIAGIGAGPIDQALERVGLSERKNDLFKTFSLGMKQRLAIAATLIKNPDLIILDEPANGLDPEGIVEIRELIRSLGDEGKTVFVSSHQLAEVQQTCDYVTIIAKGQMVTAGKVSDLVAQAGTQKTLVTIADLEQAITVLTQHDIDAAVNSEGVLQVDDADGAKINRYLADAGLYASELTAEQESLESTFLKLTAGMGQK